MPARRFHHIQKGRIGAVKWALGIFDRGDAKSGMIQQRYNTSRTTAHAPMLADVVILSRDERGRKGTLQMQRLMVIERAPSWGSAPNRSLRGVPIPPPVCRKSSQCCLPPRVSSKASLVPAKWGSTQFLQILRTSKNLKEKFVLSGIAETATLGSQLITKY